MDFTLIRLVGSNIYPLEVVTFLVVLDERWKV